MPLWVSIITFESGISVCVCVHVCVCVCACVCVCVCRRRVHVLSLFNVIAHMSTAVWERGIIAKAVCACMWVWVGGWVGGWVLFIPRPFSITEGENSLVNGLFHSHSIHRNVITAGQNCRSWQFADKRAERLVKSLVWERKKLKVTKSDKLNLFLNSCTL